jgi:hypothetical protein
MACSSQWDHVVGRKKDKPKDYDVTDVITINVFLNGKINHKEEGLLHRTIWKFFEELCLPPVGLQIDAEIDVIVSEKEKSFIPETSP